MSRGSGKKSEEHQKCLRRVPPFVFRRGNHPSTNGRANDACHLPCILIHDCCSWERAAIEASILRWTRYIGKVPLYYFPANRLSPHPTHTVDRARAVLSNKSVPSFSYRPGPVPFVKYCIEPVHVLSPVRQQRTAVFDTVEASDGSGSGSLLFSVQAFDRDNACDQRFQSCSIQ